MFSGSFTQPTFNFRALCCLMLVLHKNFIFQLSSSAPHPIIPQNDTFCIGLKQSIKIGLIFVLILGVMWFMFGEVYYNIQVLYTEPSYPAIR